MFAVLCGYSKFLKVLLVLKSFFYQVRMQPIKCLICVIAIKNLPMSY